jgi:hypothetical protein
VGGKNLYLGFSAVLQQTTRTVQVCKLAARGTHMDRLHSYGNVTSFSKKKIQIQHRH